MHQHIVWLKSKDNITIRVERELVRQSVIINDMLEDTTPTIITRERPIPIYEVNESVLRKVLIWCKRHRSDRNMHTTLNIEEWDKSFIGAETEMMFDIILAANYLDIQPLLSCGCRLIADLIKGSTPDEIRGIFNISNDFTPEEEEGIREENSV